MRDHFCVHVIVDTCNWIRTDTINTGCEETRTLNAATGWHSTAGMLIDGGDGKWRGANERDLRIRGARFSTTASLSLHVSLAG